MRPDSLQRTARSGRPSVTLSAGSGDPRTAEPRTACRSPFGRGRSPCDGERGRAAYDGRPRPSYHGRTDVRCVTHFPTDDWSEYEHVVRGQETRAQQAGNPRGAGFSEAFPGLAVPFLDCSGNAGQHRWHSALVRCQRRSGRNSASQRALRIVAGADFPRGTDGLITFAVVPEVILICAESFALRMRSTRDRWRECGH